MRFLPFLWWVVSSVLFSSYSSAEIKEPEKHIGGFLLYKHEDNCSIVSSYSNGEIIVVKYNAKTKDVTLAFTVRSATSLTEKDEKDIKIYFSNGRKLDDGWGETNFSVTVEGDGGRMLVSQPMEPELLDDFAKNQKIAFAYGDKPIGAYTLRGSSQAIPALKACAMRVAGFNPKDPFAQ